MFFPSSFLSYSSTYTVTYDAASNTALFRPEYNLLPETVYRATLGTGIKDAGGTALPQAYTWDFETGNENTEWVHFTGNITDCTGDLDGDGAWDVLAIDVEFSCLFTSRYRLNGWLLDKNGGFIATSGTDATPLVPGPHSASPDCHRGRAVQKTPGSGREACRPETVGEYDRVTRQETSSVKTRRALWTVPRLSSSFHR